MEVTKENALDFYRAMLFCRAADRLRYISTVYPEILSFTHERIAELIGMERETVTRAIKKIRSLS
jgi:CRP-like cAMP-binding protein